MEMSAARHMASASRYRSTYPDKAAIHAMKADALQRRRSTLDRLVSLKLEEGNLIDIQCPSGTWDDDLETRRERYGLPPRFDMKRSLEVERLTRHLHNNAELVRRQCWAWRAGQQQRDWDELDRYTFFVTVTVDPARADAKEIMQDGKEWKVFCTRVAEIVRQACGYRQRHRGGPIRDAYYRHLGALEHGQSREHHHMHALLWCKDIPEDWKVDPNEGALVPAYGEVGALKALWPWSSVTRMVPFRHVGDVWTRKHGHMWPCKPDGSEIRGLPAEAAGEYLGKYAGKEHKEWNHRMKASRPLGLDRLRRVLSSLSVTELLSLMEPPATYQEWNLMMRQSVPQSILRPSVRHFLIMKAGATPSGRKLLTKLGWTTPRWSVWTAMQKSVEDGMSPWSMDTAQRFDWQQTVLQHDGFVSCSDRRKVLWTELAEHFPVADWEPQSVFTGQSWN